MNDSMDSTTLPRSLTAEEFSLTKWMLENGNTDAKAFLQQLKHARVVSMCPCGCASFDLEIEGLPPPSGGIKVVADFVFGNEAHLAGVFVFERNNVLAGLEVCGYGVDAPQSLPTMAELRPIDRPQPHS